MEEQNMATTTTNFTVRMDRAIKHDADQLFSELGMSLSTAFNVFIRQSLRVQGMPFEISREVPNAETRAAMREAEHLARDTKSKGFTDMESLIKDLQS
jgi:DNA-damage-inducible protein J